ncbi:MAG TPA: polysaccharide deacetylase family protein [Gaiellaceae bacterium]|jgi:peptidoglycan/xylan/chitin deacetylase (PgdA/CDA1 family)
MAARASCRVPVLLYHAVTTQRPLLPLAVSADRFARQVDWLARSGYTGIAAGTWIDAMRTGNPLPRRPVVITLDDGYAELMTTALPHLIRRGFGATVFVVTGFLGGYPTWDPPPYTGPLMDADDIRAWATRGVEFGAHSRTHPRLTLVDDTTLHAEVRGSRDDLAEILGAPPKVFAYPYGSHDARVAATTRDSYEGAFTTDKRLADHGRDPWQLSRLTVNSTHRTVEVLATVRYGRRPRDVVRDLRLKAVRKLSPTRYLPR